MLLSTSLGDIYIELFKDEAPNNVENFLALAHGEIEFIEKDSRNAFILAILMECNFIELYQTCLYKQDPLNIIL